MAKLQKNNTNGSYWLIVPKSIVEAKGWQKGDEFLISDQPNGVKFTCGGVRV